MRNPEAVSREADQRTRPAASGELDGIDFASLRAPRVPHIVAEAGVPWTPAASLLSKYWPKRPGVLP